MESWILVRFTRQEIASGVISRLMRDLMPLALEVRNFKDVGVFVSDLGPQGKCLYFSPGAVKAFALVLANLAAEKCDSPNPKALSLLYGAYECLPAPRDERLGEEGSARILRLEEPIETGAKR